MFTAIGETLSQSIAIAISPGPIILVILMLVSAGARTNGPAFAIGWSAALLVIAGVAFALANSLDVATDSDSSDGANMVQVILGLLFFVLAIKQWRDRPKPGEDPPESKLFSLVDSVTPAKAFGLGAVFAAANPKNLPLALSAGVTIAQTGATGGDAVGAIIVFGLIAASSVVGPVIFVFIAGERSQEPLDRLKVWLMANNATIMIVLFAVLGAKMLGTGLHILD